MKTFKAILADWCVACRSLDLSKYENEFGVKFEVITDNDQLSVPTLQCFENEKMIGELHLHGYVNENSINNWLKVFAK